MFVYKELKEKQTKKYDDILRFLSMACPTMMNHAHSLFPGYTYEAGKSIYRGEEVGEGVYVYEEVENESINL